MEQLVEDAENNTLSLRLLTTSFQKKEIPIFQITFLDDVLSVTNALSLLLQSNVKDFAAISRIVSSTLQILEDIGNDFDSIYLKSFNKSAEIIEKIEILPHLVPVLNKAVKIILIHIKNSTKKSFSHSPLH